MGAGNIERIAIDIQSSANVAPIQQAGQAIQFTADEAKKAGQLIRDYGLSAEKAAEQVLKLRSATASQNAAATAGATATAANAAQSALPPTIAAGAAGATSSTTNAAAVAGGSQGIARWAASVGAANQQLALTPNRARTAANAVGILANTAATGTFSVAGFAAAVGNLAAGIATVSNAARTVATATWIGIILQIGATLYGFYEKWKGKNDEIESRVKGLRGEVESLGKKLGRDELGARIAEINARTDEEIERTKKISFHTGERIKLIDALNAKREREIQLARQQEDDERRQLALRIQSARDEVGALAGQIPGQDPFLARGREIRAQFEENKRALQEQLRTGKVEQSEYNALLQTEIDKRYYNIQLLAEERRRAMEDLRGQAMQGDLNPITRIKGELAAIEERRRRTIDATHDEVNAARVAENEKRALFQGSLQAAVRSNESFAKIAKRMLLEPIETYLEGLAIQQGIDAVASAASGNFVGAAAHAAAAAAATAGARLVAQLAGFGGGGASAAGGGGGGQFVPNGGQAGGNQTIIIHVGDVSNQALVNTVRYELDRSGLLNKPVVAPTGRPS